ncbi:MAG TPA: hypothetical protein VMZ50_08305 [Phycisphaerae bacterium]|nr:hypothetical protein [Phycisphaerae bacterium]
MTKAFQPNPLPPETRAKIGASPAKPTRGSDRWYAYLVACVYCGAPTSKTCRVRRDPDGRAMPPTVPGYASNPHRARVRRGKELAGKVGR